MRVYHYSDIRVMAATFPTVAYGSLAWSLGTAEEGRKLFERHLETAGTKAEIHIQRAEGVRVDR